MIKQFIYGILLLAISINTHAIEVISHRANICGLIENSLEAIKKSVSSNINAVEIDVRVSKDGIVYLYHDHDISFVKVKDLTYSELVTIVGIQSAPKLRDVLMKVPINGFYILDLKSPWFDQQQALVQVVKESQIPQSKIVFQSHDLTLLHSIRNVFPDSRYFYLSKLRREFPYINTPDVRRILSEIAGTEIDGVSLKGRRFISKEFVENLQVTGLDVFVWTINDIERFKYYNSIGVDGVITDRAYRFSQLINTNSSHNFECELPNE